MRFQLIQRDGERERERERERREGRKVVESGSGDDYLEMSSMADTQEGTRWRVTYTKHLKQKRKVYHDGFLHLNASRDKVRLYDECENLIDSKFLSKAESVECGKSFTMDSHLVDIADPVDLLSNPTPTSLEQTDSKKRNSFHRKPLHKISNLMQRNTRAGEKAEPYITDTPLSNSTLPHSLLEEWSVLYTTQLIQKAKKYHDGKLRLSQLGSHAKQVRLYDENERLLESKVLGKDDILASGRTLIMQGHLVDIGLSRSQVGEENSSVSSFRKPIQKPTSTIHSVIDARKDTTFVEPTAPGSSSILEEWNVLYTSQVNRKAKTYHDGILQLSRAAGSLTKQISLASEDGQILGSRYLKSFECIDGGSECELPGYLVQVYDLRVRQQGCAVSSQRSHREQFVNSKTLMKRIPANGETKKEQVKYLETQTSNSTAMDKSTSNKCISVARHDDRVSNAASNQRSTPDQFVKSKTLMKSIPTSDGPKEQVKSLYIQTGNSIEMEKSTNSMKCVNVARRDACQIMSVLRKPLSVPEGEAQLAKNASVGTRDDSVGHHKHPSAQGIHDEDGNAHHCSLTSPSSIETGTKELENAAIVVKVICSSSGMCNSSSVLTDTMDSASFEGTCGGIILEDLEKANRRVGFMETLFTDTDDCFDLPSFDLGF
ncbi:hypothetical protein LUZ61_012974 [Rhynchospora tenuis]|uniref:5'-3' DNA helicase ZGRF1-like N-terminal domain-containing protein n=1 Tax=Rhynchospora tenuis TaxID=198213 RepID=A0AAD6F1R6_9POAL|nr:hypothetical protein LUZ61_012974 [Rhynchospora tenuis]